MADDEVIGGWHIDPEMSRTMRIALVRKRLDQGEFGEAVLECEELLDENPDHPEGLFLLAEALLELGDPQSAAEAYEQQVEVAGRTTDNPFSIAALTGLAVCRFELCDIAGSVEAARDAIRLSPDLAEAHYTLGLALERIPGRKSEAVNAFAAARGLDPEAYPFPLQLDRRGWDAILAAARAKLPRKLQKFWDGVTFKIEDLPDLGELQRNDPPISPTVTGLYDGTPPEEEDEDPWFVKPLSMRLYTGNIARLGDRDAAVEEVAAVLRSEAIDWLGIGEDELEE